jgi:CRP-like cAMP-binding protein
MPRSRNRLLASLSADDFGLLEPNLKAVTLGLRKSLEKPNKRIDGVYFPECGFASVVAIQSGGKQAEVGLIGREGMTGLPIVFGNHRSPHATYMQAAGSGKRISSTDLRKATRTSQSLAVEVRAGVRSADDSNSNLQRAVQDRPTFGALAPDGP